MHTISNIDNSKYVLGISCFYHDAAAALLKDGRIIAAAEEERFTRLKHDIGFPTSAIKYCLEEAGITAKQLSYIAFYEKPILKFERLINQHMQKFPFSFRMFCRSMPLWLKEKLKIQSIIKRRLGYSGDVVFMRHHISHAASCFLPSPFQSAAILTTDGVGEWETTTLGQGKDNEIKIFKTIDFPHSLGLLYSTVTAFLGFSVNNSEYKIMGLAPHGKPTLLEQFEKIIDIKEDGSYRLDMRYFDYTHKLKMPSRRFLKLFGKPRKPTDPLTQYHKNVAATLQYVLEEAVIKMARHLHDLTGEQNLCFAGGCALNSVANGKILKNTKFKRIFIQPAAGDSGSSLGAALYVWNCFLKKPRSYVMEHAYLGPAYSSEHILNFFRKQKIKYHTLTNEGELAKKTAELIYKNYVVGWFQGRMEFGPRALGSRSILANPCNPKMKDILNLKVKHREHFRPFAPSVCVEDAEKYFECDKPLPLSTDAMMLVYPVKEKYRRLLPAITHVDGSARLQTVRKEHALIFWRVIKEFGRLSGLPVIVNTSFNIRGEPIVCTPEDAYRCMMGTGIDCLAMDRFLVWRKENLKDAWDSERYAKD